MCRSCAPSLRPTRTATCSARCAVNPDNLTPGELFGRNLHTTSDFAFAGTVGLNNALQAQYTPMLSPLLRVAKVVEATDFREKTIFKVGNFPALQRTNEHGEVRRGTIASAKEAYRIYSHAVIFGATHELIVNDQWGAIETAVRTAAVSAANTVAGESVSVLRGASGLGPVMDDTKAMFHTDHGNLGTTGAISFTTLSEGRKLMRLQTAVDSRTLIDAAPAFLIVPAALEAKAEQELADVAAVQTAKVNPFSNLQLLVEPRLDGYSATRWYLVADPQRVPGLEVAYLSGTAGPKLEMREGWDHRGVEWRLTLDFGAGFVDHRAWFTNAGA